MPAIRYVALGDSFTEGVGDELPDGSVRGWADLVAQGWADATGTEIAYANLAIRGKLIRPIIDEQLGAALALGPTHVSFNGGGNDVLRPRTSIPAVAELFREVVARCDDAGVHLIVLSGANPSAQLPLSGLIQRRGDLLAESVAGILRGRDDVLRAWNWSDRELSTPAYWSADRLHLNVRGHHRVAARVLGVLGMDSPGSWWSLPPDEDDTRHLSRSAYYREHLRPWIRRRLTGTSSGDGRSVKLGSWATIRPRVS